MRNLDDFRKTVRRDNRPANAGFNRFCPLQKRMRTVDFRILAITEAPGLALIYPQNEDAYQYLTEETNMTTLQNGAAPIERERVGDWMSDAGWAHFDCAYV